MGKIFKYNARLFFVDFRILALGFFLGSFIFASFSYTNEHYRCNNINNSVENEQDKTDVGRVGDKFTCRNKKNDEKRKR